MESVRTSSRGPEFRRSRAGAPVEPAPVPTRGREARGPGSRAPEARGPEAGAPQQVAKPWLGGEPRGARRAEALRPRCERPGRATGPLRRAPGSRRRPVRGANGVDREARGRHPIVLEAQVTLLAHPGVESSLPARSPRAPILAIGVSRTQWPETHPGGPSLVRPESGASRERPEDLRLRNPIDGSGVQREGARTSRYDGRPQEFAPSGCCQV